jgi:hypothetical protein
VDLYIHTPIRLHGVKHEDNFVNDLPVLLEDVPFVHQQQLMWFVHDGAPLHCLRTVRVERNEAFSEQRIGFGGPFTWRARSPDLNPL